MRVLGQPAAADHNKAVKRNKRNKQRIRQRKGRVLSLCQAEDLHLETLRELRRDYYKKHPIILHEIALGKLRTMDDIGRRVGCGARVLSNYYAEVTTYRDEVKAAKKLRVERYTLDGESMPLPYGCDAL